MTKYVEPIIDRDEADIIAKNSKAYFNISDWERINGNTGILKVIVDFFLGSDISIETLTTPTKATIPIAEEINNLINNIEVLRQASGLPNLGGLEALKVDWSPGTGSSAPDYENVNSWEKTIALIIANMEASVSYRCYCGVPAVGQARFYQNRWRNFIIGVPDSSTPVRRARCNVATANAGLTRNNGFRRYD